MHRCESDGAVNTDFTYPFINGTKHGVKNNKCCNQDRYKQVAHPAETRHPDTTVEVCIFITPHEEVKSNAVHKRRHDEIQLIYCP